MIAFLKKEFKEIFKTYRLWVIPLIFLLIGLSSPASAKFLPDLLEGQLKAEGVVLKLPEPSDFEAFVQYFKNLTQLGLIATILLSAGLISDEKAKGILAQVVTKPVSRPAIVLAKWLAQGSWLILSFIVGAVSCYLYTLALFDQASASRFLYANVFYLPYLLLIFSLSLAISAAMRSQIATTLIAFVGFFLISITATLGQNFARYSPAYLVNLSHKALSKSVSFSEAAWPITTTTSLIAIFLIFGIWVFNRQEV